MNTLAFILIVMFPSATIGAGGSHPFVAMQQFQTEDACKKAMMFVRSNNAYAKVECIKDERAAP
jgi:hypothetical protein